MTSKGLRATGTEEECRKMWVWWGETLLWEGIERDDWVVVWGQILECFKPSLETISLNILGFGSWTGRAPNDYTIGKTDCSVFWHQRWYQGFHPERPGGQWGAILCRPCQASSDGRLATCKHLAVLLKAWDASSSHKSGMEIFVLGVNS